MWPTPQFPCEFGQIHCKNSKEETPFFVQCNLLMLSDLRRTEFQVYKFLRVIKSFKLEVSYFRESQQSLNFAHIKFREREMKPNVLENINRQHSEKLEVRF